jgi:isocitrate dehydrogenase (NAD+)
MAITVVALDGDETGQELLEQSLRVLDPEVLGIELEVERFDLSLENRRKTNNEVCAEAAERMRETGLGLKAATITPEGADDVGSPNRILREAIDGKVILRTGRRIPGVTPVAGVHHPIAVCRMAVGDAYGAEQWRESKDGDELAMRTEVIRRSHCRAVAEFSFREAKRLGGRVYGGPKWTVSPIYEGMLKEEMDVAAERHPDCPYQPVLIDATLAGLVSGAASEPLVIPCLNRDGTTARGDDASEAADRSAELASRAVYESVLETVASGIRTSDLGGHAGTTEFTEAVIGLIGRKRA